ncbi:MAG: lipopolysaccharide assembly LapA domain-containing protein [Methylophagaceae bacterium]
MRRILTIIVFIIVFAVGIAFSAINNDLVTINYYLGTLSLPLSIVVVASIVLGLILGALAIFVGTLQLRYENRHLNKKLETSEQEINSLRILPLTDEH